MYGKLGILETGGERIQCHICGRWYRSLGHHLHLAHGTNPGEYRADFELNRTQSLMAPICREKFKELHADVLKKHNKNPAERLMAYIEKEGNVGARRKKRMQHKLDRSAKFKKSNYFKKLKEMAANNAHPFQSEDHKNKLRKKMLDGTHPFQSEKARERHRAACRTDDYRKKARDRFLQPDIRKKALEAAWSSEARKKRKRNKIPNKRIHSTCSAGV